MNIAQKFTLTRYLTVSLFVALIGLFSLTQLLRPDGVNWLVVAFQTLPLLAFVPGLVSRYYRVYSWLCFIILLYFVVAVMESLASNAELGDYLFLVLCVGLFISSMMCSRYAQRVQKNISI